MLVLILLGVVTLLVVYLHLVHRYWTRRGIFQEPPLPIVGNILSAVLQKEHIGQVLTKIYKKYSRSHDAVGIYEFLTPTLLITNPELAKAVLISEFSSFHDNPIIVNEKLDPYFYHDPFCLRGDAWKASRTSIMSLMTSNRVKEMFPYMKQQIPQLDSYLDINPSSGQSTSEVDFMCVVRMANRLQKLISAKELASLFMMDNVSNTMFGLQTNSFTDPEADFRKMGELLIEDLVNNWFRIFIMKYFPKVRNLLGYSIISPKINHYLENMMKKIVEHRKINNIKRNDAIQNIMNKTGDNVFDMVVLGMAIFVDGFETSATTISFTLYELAMNPQIQQNLYEEIKPLMADFESIEYETILNLKLLDNIIKESMRKYPVLHAQDRLCTRKCTLNIDGKPVEIESNTVVVIPTYAIHTDPQYWPNPEVFDPERFSNSKSIQPCTYLPFGEGPRICPGMKFANVQMRLFLANIVYKYKILCSENTPSIIKLSKTSLLLSSEDPLMLRFERRS